MTETSSLLATYSVPNSYSVTAPPTSVSPIPNGTGTVSPPAAAEEEEYTIKCICGYNDDDGNTVFCEKCDTWQHIECYYHAKKVPDIHFCTDCAPKDTFPDINAEKARERQRRARELLEGGGDRKVKRPANKGQRKKHRDTVTTSDQPNGYPNHDRQDPVTIGRDQPPPAKKTKITHRASGSIASLNGESRKRAHSNVQSYPSPSKSPQELYRYPIIPRYTSDFLELYRRDTGHVHAQGNEHTIQGSLALSSSKTDPSLVTTQPENAQSDKTIFTRVSGDWHDHKLPSVTVEETQGKEIEFDERLPTWKRVRLLSDVRRNTIVGEIRGQIGTLDEYCQQLTGSNRWKDLSHPDPFVFFHPHMHVYIDSRRSGTQFRYIRRSCDPNVTLRSYITPDDEVHHCFVARDDILAGTELTASWYLPPQFLVNDATRDDKEQLSFQERCDYVSRVLANFGDCACGLPKCRLDPFDRRSSMKPPDPPKAPGGRRKKTKNKHAISPLSTGQATNSRAGSETVKGPEEDDDHRSSSGSSRNGAQSRDLTPQGGALLDEPPVLGAGLTQREIRKIQALEKASKEQSQKVDKKPKKRPSGASNLNTPSTFSVKQSSLDAKVYSDSPPPHRALKDVSNRSMPLKHAQKQLRPVYVSTGMQTEPIPEETEQCSEAPPPLKRRKFCTPTQRLLRKLLHQRAQFKAAAMKDSSEVVCQDLQLQDAGMRDATTSVSTSPSTDKSPPTSPVTTSASHDSSIIQGPLPSQAAHTHQVHGLFKTPAPRLNLSSLPPVPVFSSTITGSLGSSCSVTTPTPAQSPGSFIASSSAFPASGAPIINPSPAKKKLSLGDYMKRKESATPSSERPSLNLPGPADVEQELRNSETRSEPDIERKSSDTVQPLGFDTNIRNVNTAGDDEAIEDIQMADLIDAAFPVSDGIAGHLSSSTSISTEVRNVLSSLQEMQNKQELDHV